MNQIVIDTANETLDKILIRLQQDFRSRQPYSEVPDEQILELRDGHRRERIRLTAGDIRREGSSALRIVLRWRESGIDPEPREPVT